MQKINVNILQKPKTIQTSVKNITPINPAKGTKTILQNGVHNIKEFEFISVNVKPDKLQEKEIEIVSNGKYEVAPDDEYFLTKVKVDVNVPIPDDYIIPEGTLEIKDNGTFDVRQFEYVLINVPIPEEYIVPEGKINITNTQEVDVTQYAKAQVVDPNLKAENIVEGVEVLGIIGKYVGEGVKINGDIENIEALEPITAGDFVEFINNVNKKLTSDSYSCYREPSAILLEPNKAFIAHSYGTNCLLYGTIVEINGTEMTVTTTRLNNSSYSCYSAPNCILLENNKVFIAHCYDRSHLYLYGTIVEINGTEMTATTTQLSSNSNNANYAYVTPNCILLENNKIFITYCYSYYLYGTIVEINGTEMTATTTALKSSSDVCKATPSAILLEPNKVFIAHNVSSYWNLYGTIVEINGTEMTATAYKYLAGSYIYYPKCILLEPNKILIVQGRESYYYLYGTIIEINGTEMKTKSTQLNSNYNSCYSAPSAILLEPNKAFIAHSYGSDNYILYGTIVEINGTEMTATTTQLNSTKYSSIKAPSAILLENNKVFIAHGYNNSYYYLYGTLYLGTKAIQLTNTINGVAKTSGAAGETIEVYVPKEAN